MLLKKKVGREAVRYWFSTDEKKKWKQASVP